jgi:transposase-like protein
LASAVLLERQPFDRIVRWCTVLAFYDFPAEHWKHLRTTNPIESTFAMH